MFHPATLQVIGVSPEDAAVTWPLICGALKEQGILTDLVEVAVAATLIVEVGSGFKPIREIRAHPTRNARIYALQQRYWPSGFFGRGYVQLTWEKNYRRYGNALGIDLVANPDKALEPETAARILALYFKESRAAAFAEAKDWRAVRKAVNGGFNHWDEFNTAVCKLLEVIGA